MLVSRNKRDVIRKGFTMGWVVEAVTKEINELEPDDPFAILF